MRHNGQYLPRARHLADHCAPNAPRGVGERQGEAEEAAEKEARIKLYQQLAENGICLTCQKPECVVCVRKM